MAKLTAIALFTLLFAAIASPSQAAAPKPDGKWEIISDQDNKPIAMIQLRTVRGVVSGVLTQSLRGESPYRVCDKCQGAQHNKRIIGMTVLWSMTPDPTKPLVWQGGQILDPDSGNIYSALLTLSDDGRTITMRGFVGIALIGRTQMWYKQ